MTEHIHFHKLYHVRKWSDKWGNRSNQRGSHQTSVKQSQNTVQEESHKLLSARRRSEKMCRVPNQRV